MVFEVISDFSGWIVSLLIGLVTLYLVRFYKKVFTLPKGPFPIPIFGNVLSEYLPRSQSK
jgi:hypothetical protein